MAWMRLYSSSVFSVLFISFWFLGLGLGVVEGKILWRELSETIKARGMREIKKEGHYSGERIKERIRGE
jgi:hypothetical protein